FEPPRLPPGWKNDDAQMLRAFVPVAFEIGIPNPERVTSVIESCEEDLVFEPGVDPFVVESFQLVRILCFGKGVEVECGEADGKSRLLRVQNERVGKRQDFLQWRMFVPWRLHCIINREVAQVQGKIEVGFPRVKRVGVKRVDAIWASKVETAITGGEHSLVKK